MPPVETFLRRYARRQARDVAPWIVGPRVLDLGAGEGFVLAALGTGTAVDVGPFRRAAVPYVVYDGSALPFSAATFDMAKKSAAAITLLVVESFMNALP